MLQSIRSHLRNQWIGVLALFLVVAGGGAYAAFDPIGQDGDIDACFQKRSGDLDVLKGKKCNKGEKPVSWSQAGPRGPQGLEGTQGPEGLRGPAGDTGPPGRSALEPLRSGETVYGTWAMKNETAAAVSRVEAISLPIPSPVPLSDAIAHVDGNDEPPGNPCAGTAAAPAAAPGHACVYFSYASGTTSATGDGVTNVPNGSRYGFELFVNGGNFWEARGTWAYTAP